MASAAFRDSLCNVETFKMEKITMGNYKIDLTNEHEGKIAAYCAQNNIEFDCANAYTVTLDTFKDNPIIYVEKDPLTGSNIEHKVTARVARYIEMQPRTIERIAAKAEVMKIKIRKEEQKRNIEKANIDSKPDLEALVDNLYKLNIVNGYSYLAFICFLMQLKYTRNNKITENDKTCVFFNGVARNGKSATAQAICDVEEQYGIVFKAQSGKLLEGTHEEQVWKSHLNYFDEVKPVDIDREQLLTIVNGGNVEINPKNKKHYNYYVNTNNIFTSNDEISLRQRRVSVIKFGDRLNGRPLGVGTLKNIITNIMNSLPNFDRYYEIYNKVSVHNERAFNPLALESILTFMENKFGQVTGSANSRERTIIFKCGDIYQCIKGNYNKQILKTERKDAIRETVEKLEKDGYLTMHMYPDCNCSTKFYKISGENYLKIAEMNDKHNTKNENNVKISKTELYELLLPYFKYLPQEDFSNTKEPEKITFEVGPQTIFDRNFLKLVDYTVYNGMTNNGSAMVVTADTQNKGTILYYGLLRKLNVYINDINGFLLYEPLDNIIEDILKDCVTEEICKNIQYKYLNRLFKAIIPDFREKHEKMLAKKYAKLLYTNMDSVLVVDDTKFAGTDREDFTDEKDWEYYRQLYQNSVEKRRQKQCALVAENKNANISNLQLSDELSSVQANCDKLQNEVKDKTEAAKELTERLEKNIAETAKEANLERTARQKAEDELLELKFKTGIITEDEYYDALGIPF